VRATTNGEGRQAIARGGGGGEGGGGEGDGGGEEGRGENGRGRDGERKEKRARPFFVGPIAALYPEERP